MRKRWRLVALALTFLLMFLLTFQTGRLLERFMPLLSPERSGPSYPNPVIPATANQSEPLTPSARMLGLATIWEQARTSYPFWHRLEGLDWDQAYQAYVPRALAAEDDLAYYRVLQEFIALLQDGHTSVQIPARLQAQLDQPAIRLLPCDGQLVVADALEALVQKGLARGAVLTAIDGRPISQVLAEAKARMPASTEPDRMERAARAVLEGAAGSRVTLTFTPPAGGTQTLTVLRDRRTSGWPAASPRPLTVKDLGDGLYLVTISTFSAKEVVAEFNQALPNFRGVKGLIFDVRENGGGNSSYGEAIISRLIRLPLRTNPWKTRERIATVTAWGRGERWYSGPPQWVWPSGLFGQYRGPVVVLTSPRTYSAAEDFTSLLKASGRAQIVGQPTGGSTGQPLNFPLPGGGNGRVLTKWDTFPDGTEFVGVGIQPDVAVTPTVADLAAGRDPGLEKAKELLAKR